LELPPQLADTAGAEAELPGDVAGALAGHQVIDDQAVAPAEGEQPGREVAPEHDLLGDRRLGVVAQPLLEGVLLPLAQRLVAEPLVDGRRPPPLDPETRPPLGRGRPGLPGGP